MQFKKLRQNNKALLTIGGGRERDTLADVSSP